MWALDDLLKVMIGDGMDLLGLALGIVAEGAVDDVIDFDYTLFDLIKSNTFINWR
jgi:hypothetical protein